MLKTSKSHPLQIQEVLELEDSTQGFETASVKDLFYSDLLEAIRTTQPDVFEKIHSGEVTMSPFRSHYLG